MIDRLSVSRRIVLVLAIGVATPAFVSIQSLVNFRQALLEARGAEVRHLDEVVWSTVAGFYDRAIKGQMTEEAAKDAAKSAVRAMRYDGTNYFFIWDMSGTGVVHGGNPSLEGKNFLTGPNATSNPGVADMVSKLVSIARDKQEGFAYYKIPKPGETTPLDKIGYSKLFSPWNWAIGTGAYVTDIDAVFWSRAKSDLAVTVGCTILAGLLSFVLGRDLSRALRRLTAAMKGLAAGNLTAAIPAVSRRDEVGMMARTVQVFRDNALRAQALEKEASDLQGRRAAEDEAVRREAEERAAAVSAALVVGSIGAGLERLATGDLTYRLEETLPPAYEKLRTDLNSATSQLGQVIRGIISHTSAIQSGAGEITHAADDLSGRTEHQAASLEQTAAALSQITTTVKRTAAGSDEARTVVAAACDDAERTESVVRGAVAAMGEIEKSSTQISQIIGVIDEIAFQTNLLALNAGVEAARAGEAGRGFAVVASEVRALAQRSAQAAKEIKVLISASTQQVSQGVKLVGDAGQALDRIMGRVNEVNATIGKIAASAQEQAAALHQVNAAVNQMDQVTQQNAAMVEQTTAAGHTLQNEAEELVRLTGRFRVESATSRSANEAGQSQSGTAMPVRLTARSAHIRTG